MNGKRLWKFLYEPLIYMLGVYMFVMTMYALFLDVTSFKKIQFVAVGALIYMMAFHVAPLMVLFVTHFRLAKRVEVNFFGSQIAKISIGNVSYDIMDISFVEHYMSLPLYHSRFDWSLWNHYFFFVFTDKTGKKFSISCLQIDVESIPRQIEIRRKKKIFVIPKGQ